MAKACGAKTRSGEPCKRAPMEGKTRCRLHGGASTGPKVPNVAQNAIKHGFYSDALLPEERQLYERAEVGSLDDEIRLARVKLHRFVRLSGSLELMDMVDGALEVIRKTGMAYDQAEKEMAPFDKKEIRAAAPDYADLILRQIDLIRKLELARADLQKADPAERRAEELHALQVEAQRLEIERKRKDAAITNGQVMNNIMPVPTADSVDSWEQVATAQQDKVLGR
ncbi:HGGxSTG domain-containing protein [Burkholderia ubonensis]|nr:HGGxSTG domain-containing protein [Burkholderia ubonensis]